MLPSPSEEAGFWISVAEAPDDPVPMMIFADWLEEHNDPRAPIFRERQYRRFLNAEDRNPIQLVFKILDAGPTGSIEPLFQTANLVGEPLIPGLLHRCRDSNDSSDILAFDVLAALSPQCLLPILPDLIELLPRSPDTLAQAIGKIGPAAVSAVPALLEVHLTGNLDLHTFVNTITEIGPTAGSPEVIARLVDGFCAERESSPREDIANALLVVALPCLENVMKTVLLRAPSSLITLAWKWSQEKTPIPTNLQNALHASDECVRWATACALARHCEKEAVPQMLDALRRAPTPLLEPVVWAMQRLGGKQPEALPLLRELLSRRELPFADSVASTLLDHSVDPAEEAVNCLSDPDPLVRQRIVLGMNSSVTKEKHGRHALVHALIDPVLEVRQAAARYCLDTIFLSPEDKEVLPVLRRALDDADAQVRVGAVNALRHLKREASPAEGVLLRLLRQDPDATVRRRAGYSLATLEYETQAMFEGLDAGLDDQDAEVRRVCAWGLCHWHHMTAERVGVLLRRMREVDKGLAEYLAFGICRSQVALPEVVAFLHEVLRTKNTPLRTAAALRLGRLRVDDGGVVTELFAYFDSGHLEVAEALCLVGPTAVPGLVKRLQLGATEVREKLLRYAGDLLDSNPHLEDLLPGVLTCLREENGEVRELALRVLEGSKRRSAEAAQLVEQIIRQSRDCDTRCAAVEVLAHISPNPKAVTAFFVDLQNDLDEEVRAAVPTALAELELSPEVELKLLRTALHDSVEDVREAALWRAEALGPVAAPLLPDILDILDGLKPEDWARKVVFATVEKISSVTEPALEEMLIVNRSRLR